MSNTAINIFNKYCFATLLALCLLFCSSSWAKSVNEIYEESLPSIVVVIAYDEKNLPLSLGTGFYISSSEVVTNHHVVDGASRIVLKPIDTADVIEAKDITSYSKGLDLAILDVEPDESKGLNLLAEFKVRVGTPVIAIGNPSGLEGTVSEGIVSALRDVDNYKVIQTTTPMSPGSSGGPLFNLKGEVIAVTTAAMKGGENLNFAVPIHLLNKLKEHENWEPSRTVSHLKAKTGRSGVALIHFRKKNPYGKTITYSLKNNSKHIIKNIRYLIVFKDENNHEPLHYNLLKEESVIAPGASRRIKQIDPMLKGLTTNPRYKDPRYASFAEAIISAELRVLSYEIQEASSKALLDIDNLL